MNTEALVSEILYRRKHLLDDAEQLRLARLLNASTKISRVGLLLSSVGIRLAAWGERLQASSQAANPTPKRVQQPQL